VLRLTDREKIVRAALTSFTSYGYPVGTDFEYFGNGLASL